uniref:RING finger protein 122-like n=1 Tax=Sinocyclocheilus grahami TaxID=75366 RepID=A0A672RK66_SINGR
MLLISVGPGCFCGLGLIYSNKTCTMASVTFQDLPLNIYMVIFGTGIFVFVLSLIFCCYFISKLRHQAQSERFGYREVILKGDPKKLNLHGVRNCPVYIPNTRASIVLENLEISGIPRIFWSSHRIYAH